MKKLILSSILALSFVVPSAAQTDTLDFVGPLRFTYTPVGANDKPILTSDLDGIYIKSISASGSIVAQLSDNTESTFILDVGDGVLDSASFVASTQTLTLTLADTTEIDVDLSGLTTLAEVNTAIASEVADWAEDGNTDLIPSSKLAASGTDGQVLTRTATSQAWETPTGGGGGGGGLSSVSTNATLEGDGTIGDPLGVADEGVDTDQLADDAVDTDQIADDAVTQAKLANNSVHAAQIGANAVDSSEIASDAVGTNELEDDAVTNAKLADDSVHNVQLASNSVRADEIQANAVGTSELVGDVTERLCPDPSGGTSGQVCARNAAGDAYELVTQSGGGGGGTDDQTASEVPVTATGFSGNLGATDTDVQTALDTIDGFTLGGGGGGAGTSEQRIESVTFADVDNITSTATTLTLAATTPIAVEFGDGTAEMLTGTGGETTFTIADSGVYMFEFSVRSTRQTATAPRHSLRSSWTATTQ